MGWLYCCDHCTLLNSVALVIMPVRDHCHLAQAYWRLYDVQFLLSVAAKLRRHHGPGRGSAIALPIAIGTCTNHCSLFISFIAQFSIGYQCLDVQFAAFHCSHCCSDIAELIRGRCSKCAIFFFTGKVCNIACKLLIINKTVCNLNCTVCKNATNSVQTNAHQVPAANTAILCRNKRAKLVKNGRKISTNFEARIDVTLCQISTLADVHPIVLLRLDKECSYEFVCVED